MQLLSWEVYWTSYTFIYYLCWHHCPYYSRNLSMLLSSSYAQHCDTTATVLRPHVVWCSAQLTKDRVVSEVSVQGEDGVPPRQKDQHSTRSFQRLEVEQQSLRGGRGMTSTQLGVQLDTPSTVEPLLKDTPENSTFVLRKLYCIPSVL